MIAAAALLLSLLFFSGATPSHFEQQQGAAQARSPRRLSVRLTTPGHREIFHVGERIPLQVEYSSSLPDHFEVDVADDRNVPPLTDQFYVYPPGDRLRNIHGAVCCSARRVVLGPQPVVVKSHIELRVPQPETMLVYMTTQRVFRRRDPNLYQASSLHSASQLLRLEVVPADDAWQEQALRAVQQKLRREPASSLTHWATCRDLAVLDIPAAVQLKLAWLRNAGPCSENSMFQSFNRLPQAEAALLGLMKRPDVAITPGMMKSLIAVRLRQSQRWLFLIEPDLPQDFPHSVMSLGYAATAAGDQAVKELTPYLAGKTPAARALSETTFGQFSTAKR